MFDICGVEDHVEMAMFLVPLIGIFYDRSHNLKSKLRDFKNLQKNSPLQCPCTRVNSLFSLGGYRKPVFLLLMVSPELIPLAMQAPSAKSQFQESPVSQNLSQEKN